MKKNPLKIEKKGFLKYQTLLILFIVVVVVVLTRRTKGFLEKRTKKHAKFKAEENRART